MGYPKTPGYSKEKVLEFLTSRRDYYQRLIDKIEDMPEPIDYLAVLEEL